MADYPYEPGWRRGPHAAQSKGAAGLAAINAGPLKLVVLDLLAQAPATPEELKQRLSDAGRVALLNTVRARCTDLRVLGLVCASGTFGIGEGGHAKTTRLRLTNAVERGIFNTQKALEAEKTTGDE